MDRNFKLRQMFSDYLELKARGSTATPPTFPPADMLLSNLSEDDKKRAQCKKITEEEAENLDFPDACRLVVISEPSFEMKWYNKVDVSAPSPRQKSEEETVKLAQRLLQLFMKTEMLESMIAFKYDDVRAIRVFFMDDREVPTERLVAILDNIFTSAMTKLVQFSDKISVVVDYEIRAFMSDLPKAKRLVLETMLKFPEYIPDSWGGEAAIVKWKEAKEADVRRREADEKEREIQVDAERKEKEKEDAKKKEKEEKIKKEVEEAEKKKKEEKEKRKKEAQEQKKKEKEEKKREEEEKEKKEKKKKEKEENKKKKTKRGPKKSLDASKTKENSKEATQDTVPTPTSPMVPSVPTTPPAKKTPGKKSTNPNNNTITLSKESTVETKPSALPNTGGGGGVNNGHSFVGRTKGLFMTPGRKAKKNQNNAGH